MVALSKSSFLTRSKRCAEIFNLGAQEATSLKKFVTDGTSLADRLHHLAETKLSTGTQMLDQVSSAFYCTCHSIIIYLW